MSKAKFTYDESGATFFYFLLSFLALILVPSTYYLWPHDPQENEAKSDCRCSGCESKKQHLGEYYKWKRSRRKFVRVLIVLGWLIFIIVAYRCTTVQHEYVNWDPFEILGVPENASPTDIKRAYRRLSLIYHPDKDTGDQDRFVKITKAYAALTDDEARKNWELYGNPDGPEATSFGIALPSWIVEKENSFVVLGIYALIFMVALPVSVGVWWYRSIKFGNDQVLMTTTKLYLNYIYHTPNMAVKRVILILSGSLEFSKEYNTEVVTRETDNIEVPRLLRDLNMRCDKIKELPFFHPFSVKARAIIYAHLNRMKLPSTTLEQDRCFIIRKCPNLLHEFVQCVPQIVTLALAGRVSHAPPVATLENAMKLSPLLIQALLEYSSPLLQLPHVTLDTLRQLERKKIKVRTIEQLARMKESDRRSTFKNFSDAQYEDVRHVISNMPRVLLETRFEVLDDEDPCIITAGAIVTVSATLKRSSMKELFNDSITSNDDVYTRDEISEASERNSSDIENEKQNLNQSKAAEAKSVKASPKTKPDKNSQREKGQSQEKDKEVKEDLSKSESDEEEEWDKSFQDRFIKKQRVYETKPKKSHTVHCPFFPDDKQEFWWLYVVDRKRNSLVTAPILVTSLVRDEEVELKFTAPAKPGSYFYTTVVRSDSYVDCTVQKTSKIEVLPAREYSDVSQDYSEEEEEADPEDDSSAVEDPDLLTDDDDDD